ncbi:MAG TPA: hypothetical protein VHV51_20075 [Polyangiaceae bacterium]|jgi:hypothetical protein|nr:hypothetical protein [Polyangiaceae bacterium]
MPAPGTCRCCAALAKLDQGICEACAHNYGPRAAQLLARCQVDSDFASAFLSRLPEALRGRFMAALAAQCLAPRKGPGLAYTRPSSSSTKRASA